VKENEMQIIVNGDPVDIEEGLSVGALLARLGQSAEHVAVECNGDILESTGFASLLLGPADRLEIVHFVGGG
jgi:sulfur carrier protein